MPRWLQILLTLFLFTTAMLALGWVLRQVVPTLVDTAAGQVGMGAVLTILLTLSAAGFAFTYWPRNPDGTRRLPRRG